MKSPLLILALVAPSLLLHSHSPISQVPPETQVPGEPPADEGLTLAQRISQFEAQVLIAENMAATPLARGQAAIKAIDLMWAVDPSLVLPFAQAMAQDPMVSTLGASTKAALKVRFAQVLMTTSGFAAAEGWLGEAVAAQPSSAEIAARAALVRVKIAQVSGKASDRQEIANTLGAAVQNTALPLEVRLEAGAAQIQVFLNYGTESNLHIAALGNQLVALAGNSVSESALHARGVVLGSRVVTQPDVLRQQQIGQSVTPLDFAFALDGLFIALYEEVVALEASTLERFGANSRAYAVNLCTHVLATVQVSHQEPEIEAEMLAECRASVAKLLEQPHQWVNSQKIRSLKFATAIRFNLPSEMVAVYDQTEQDLADPATSQQAALFVLSSLPPYAQTHPQEASVHWKKAIDVFSHTIREIALQNPDQAVNALGAWNSNWASYKIIPESGYAQSFLEAYSKITGIVKTIPYQSLNSGNVEVLLGDVSLSDIQLELSAAHPMLVFVKFSEPLENFATGGSYGAFLLKGSSVTYRDLGNSVPIDAAIKAWEDSIVGVEEQAPVGDPMVTGAALYNLLLEPVFGSNLPNDLYIVPDGRIGDVSFAGLVTPAEEWVVEETSITYLSAMRDVAATTTTSPQSHSRVLYATDFANSGELSSPELTIEAMKALDPAASKTLISAEAVQAMKGPRYLHISTHGKYDLQAAADAASVGRASRLVFPGQGRDPHVTANEVARWNLTGTQLATLAVCDAGKSNVLAGEGVGGLRRALQLAGVSQVITSVRKVYGVRGDKDAPGDYLLSLVYQSHRKGVSPARSLRQAQIAMCRKFGPAYWAGFICEGR